MVTPRAEEVFDSVVAERPNDGLAHYFLAIAAEQREDSERALEHLEVTLGDSPPDAPWMAEARARYVALQTRVSPGQRDEGVVPPGSPEEMVSRLAGRLAKAPDDLDGWLMLVRSYTVLGRHDDARGALDSARRHFSGNEEAAMKLDAAAVELDLPSSGD
jgi:cytochrome c-type biogenesis protein CcmH